MNDLHIEQHPFKPFIDSETKLLIMGTFPPPRVRWSMEFFYPNRINDFWYMMGVIFYGDRNALLVPGSKDFDLPKIKDLLTTHHIGMSDTGYRIRRLQGNASDKFLEIVEPIDLQRIRETFPRIQTLCTTGEKAAAVIAELTGTPMPKMGEHVVSNDGLNIWRMPSTSRAYPLALERKADYYRTMFIAANILRP